MCACVQAALDSVRAGRLNLGRVRTLAIDEVDAVCCMEDPWEQGLRPDAAELVGLLRGTASAAAPAPQPGASTLLILTSAHVSDVHDAELAKLFPGVERVAQPCNGSGKRGVLVPTCQQHFHYVNPLAGRAARDAKLLSVLHDTDADAWFEQGSINTMLHSFECNSTRQTFSFLQRHRRGLCVSALLSLSPPLPPHPLSHTQCTKKLLPDTAMRSMRR